MSRSSRPWHLRHLWNPHLDDPHNIELLHPGQTLQKTSSHSRAAVLYKMWSFGASQQPGIEHRPSLMRTPPTNRRFLPLLKRKPNLSKRRFNSAISNLDFDDEQEDFTQPGTEYRLEKPSKEGDSFNSKQEQQKQQSQGNLGGHTNDEESKPLTVGPAHLRLAMTKPKTTFAMQTPPEDLPALQKAIDVLAYFTQAMLRLRDKGTHSHADLKLRPLMQELMLCLFSTLLSYGTLPMTKLDAIRQYLIDAVQEHEKNSQDQGKEEKQKKEEGEEGEEGENKPNKKPPEANLPQATKNLNLLMPLIILSSQRPSTADQLKLACGRIKTLIRTATK